MHFLQEGGREVKTPYDEDARKAERERNKSDAKFFRRARRKWFENRNIVSAHWQEVFATA